MCFLGYGLDQVWTIDHSRPGQTIAQETMAWETPIRCPILGNVEEMTAKAGKQKEVPLFIILMSIIILT